MIEVIKYKPVEKNSLQGILDIKVPKWGNFIIRDISFFKKDNKKWISFPSKPYEKDGQKKYYSYNLFEDRNTQEAFQQKVMEALEIYLATNQGSSQESQQMGIPF